MSPFSKRNRSRNFAVVEFEVWCAFNPDNGDSGPYRLAVKNSLEEAERKMDEIFVSYRSVEWRHLRIAVVTREFP